MFFFNKVTDSSSIANKYSIGKHIILQVELHFIPSSLKHITKTMRIKKKKIEMEKKQGALV